jgi:hypothetical protein
MVTCVECQQRNVDGVATCSRCGAQTAAHSRGNRSGAGSARPGMPSAAGISVASGLPVATGLTAGSAGGGSGGIDEYQRLMADRNAKQKRNRTIFMLVALVVVGGAATVMVMNNKKAKAAQEILEQGGRFAERDKVEMGAFWNCITSSEVDVGNFKGVDEIQMRIESAYFTQQKTFSEHLLTECVPKIERARTAMGALASDFPAGMKEALDKYLVNLPKLQTGIESYAEKVKGRVGVKDIDKTIQEVAAAFSSDPTPESIAFEKFLACAIPDLEKKQDLTEIKKFLFETCKADAVKFMTRVREKCGPLVQDIDAKAKPSKSFKANTKKFCEENGRQDEAFEYCAKHSRKGKKALDLEEFLNASGDFMEARAEVAQATRDTAARITGKVIEAPKKKEPAAGSPAAP